MKKIVLLTSLQASVRERLLFSEGLLEHAEVIPFFNNTDYILGKKITEATDQLYDKIMESDYVFQFENEHMYNEELLKFVKKQEVASKLVYLDFNDSPKINYRMLNLSYRYFKRSWPRQAWKEYLLHGIFANGRSIYPLTYGALDCYFDQMFNAREKEYDVSFLFPKNVGGRNVGGRRERVLKEIEKYDWGGLKVNLKVSTSDGSVGRKSINSSIEENPWVQYMKAVYNSRIIITAMPNRWDGDSRTWEALASDAMAFIDKPVLPFNDRMVHMEHAYIYDARSVSSIQGALDYAANLLRNDDGNIEKVASNGREFVRNFHRGVNRVNEILNSL